MLFDDGSVEVSVRDQQDSIVVKVKHEEFEIQYKFEKKSDLRTIEEQRRRAVLDAAYHLQEAGTFILNKRNKFSRGELSRDSIML